MKKLISLFLSATALLFASQAFAAFTGAVTDTTVFGPKMIKYGTYTSSGGSTGGDITTNLNVVQGCYLTASGAAVDANSPAINETFPLVNSTGAVTIVTTANATGYFMCFGF